MEIYIHLSNYSISIAILPFPMHQGRRESVDGGTQLWMTHICLPFWERSHFTDKNIQVIYIKNSQGRAEFLPWSFWGPNTREKKKKTEQTHTGDLYGSVNQAGLERSFSDLKIKKTRLRNRLTLPRLEKMAKVGILKTKLTK